MNYWFISAGIFLFISLLIHMIAGDKDYCKLNSSTENKGSDKVFGFWLMGRGTFQMVSVDLLLTSIAIFLMGISVISYSFHLIIFIAFLYAGYLIFWLFTLCASKAKPMNYLKQGQWILFLIAFVLIVLGL